MIDEATSTRACKAAQPANATEQLRRDHAIVFARAACAEDSRDDADVVVRAGEGQIERRRWGVGGHAPAIRKVGARAQRWKCAGSRVHLGWPWPATVGHGAGPLRGGPLFAR